MAIKYYGQLEYVPETRQWSITKAPPHVCIKLKAVFKKIQTGAVQPFNLSDIPDMAADLHWFLQRYPMKMTEADAKYLTKRKNEYVKIVADLETIMLPSYKPGIIKLKKRKKARVYQSKGNEVFMKKRRMLLGDEFGLGKTLSAILPMTIIPERTLPAVVVVQGHMQAQWETDGINQYTNLTCHCIKSRKTYDLPAADVYIVRYTCVSGWVNVFQAMGIKYLVFDEVQELRTGKSAKYDACFQLSNNVAQFCQGLSATPIYNYGGEIFNILDAIDEGCLGTKHEFDREWTGWGNKIDDPEALGTHLREKFLFLRRTREEVGMQLPPINTVIYTVEHDHQVVKESYEMAKQLALRVVHGEFTESGQAARIFDNFLRKTTGISKAKYVAAFVRMMIESGETVLLGGWHHEVYDIWEKEFADLNPCWFTGLESPTQKEKSKQTFIKGESKLLIMSNRSGAGVDGLQERCSIVVNGELDWSPKIHEQFYSRLNRDRKNKEKKQVTAVILISEYGSDPLILDILGEKSRQQQGIVDPGKQILAQQSDVARVKLLAQKFLEKEQAA